MEEWEKVIVYRTPRRSGKFDPVVRREFVPDDIENAMAIFCERFNILKKDVVYVDNNILVLRYEYIIFLNAEDHHRIDKGDIYETFIKNATADLKVLWVKPNEK
jgi:hypothetical protein